MGQLTFPVLTRALAEEPEKLPITRRHRWWDDRYLVAVIGCAAVLSVAATVYAAQNHLILLWVDALSHLQIARRVFDNVSPGLAQFGGIWLPLPHLVMLPFIWIMPLWQSGLAGSIPSMVAYVVAAVYGFLFARRLTGDDLASFIGVLVFLLNPNILYLQATPLSELILVATMTMACYYFLAWVQQETTQYLLLTGLCTFLATLARYDGWALFAALLAGIAIIGWMRRRPIRLVETQLLLFGLLGGLGIALWFLWNAIIFGDPLYFQHSQFSSQAQQLPNIQAGLDIPYHNLFQAIRFYSIVAAENVGPALLVLGLAAIVVFLMRKSFSPIFIAACMILTPFGFYIVSLFSGQAVIFAPGAGPDRVAIPLYNVRYGAQMVLPIAVLLPLLISRAPRAPGDLGLADYLPALARRLALIGQRIASWLPEGISLAQIVVVVALTAQTALLVTGGIITLQEGQYGVDCFHYSTIPAFMARHDNGGLILNDPYFNLQDLALANISFNRIVYEGSGTLWDKAISDPAAVVDWIIVKPGDLVAQHIDLASPAFTQQFALVGADPRSGVQVFHRISAPPLSTRPIATDLVTDYNALCDAGHT